MRSESKARLCEMAYFSGNEWSTGSPFDEDYTKESDYLDFFKEMHENYPEYLEFEFECETIQIGCSCCPGDSHEHQWYLIGTKTIKDNVLEELEKGSRDLAECLTSSCPYTREAAKEFNYGKA